MSEDAIERWMTVAGYPKYEVSDHGRVRRGSRVLKAGVGSNGYAVVALSAGKPKSVTVHRLVAEAFIGHRPPKHDVCHKDGDKANNRASNLRYDTRSGNEADKALHGSDNRGERCGTNKYPPSVVLGIRQRYASGVSARQLAEDNGIPLSTIWGIVRRQTWRWL